MKIVLKPVEQGNSEKQLPLRGFAQIGGAHRVQRGGSKSDYTSDFLVSFRGSYYSSLSLDSIGLRIVRNTK
jgi:formylglycine-generating enzyme required for sulfatase activity